MKTMLRIAFAAVSIGTIGPAFADQGEGGPAASFSTYPPVVTEAQAQDVQRVPPVATAQSGQAIQTYTTQSNGVVSLYAPDERGNG